MKKAAKFWFFW